MAKCRISYNAQGVATVLNSIGTPSKLYEKILDITESQEAALVVWDAANDPEFGLRGEATTIEELLSFMDSHASTMTPLTQEEVANVTEVMRRRGFKTLSEFTDKMNKVFKPNGFIQMPASATGLFTQDDLRDLNLTELSRLMQRANSHLIKKGEIYATPYSQQEDYIDTDNRNIFGMSERISYPEMRSIIIKNIKDFTSVTEIERAVKASPFTKLIKDYNTKPNFRENFNSSINGLRRVPTLTVVAGELSSDNNEYYTTVKNTIVSGLNTLPIEAEMEYLASIDQVVWQNSPELARTVIKEIESKLAEMGIDVIGISEHFSSKEVIIDILNEVTLMLRQPTHSNIKAFTDKLSKLVPQPDNSVVELIDDRYKDMNIVSMESNFTQSELFNKFGMIKIGENLYHKVDQEANIDTIVDFMYNEIYRGEYELPKEFSRTKDLTNKVGVLEDIHTYLGAQTELEDLTNKNLYTAYKTIFGHVTVRPNLDNVRRLGEIEGNSDYLKTGFVLDFYKYILKEKFNNTQTYRNTLSQFAIRDLDITLTGKPISIEGIKMSKELKDYIRLKRGSKMDYLLAPSNSPLNEDLLVLNFPEIVKEFTGEYMVHGDSVVVTSSPETYIKIKGELYRKSGSKEGADIYTLVRSSSNETYYTNNLNFEFDKSQVLSELNSHQELVTPKEAQADIGESLFNETNNIEDYSTILDSRIKVVTLYNKSTIKERLDECAG